MIKFLSAAGNSCFCDSIRWKEEKPKKRALKDYDYKAPFSWMSEMALLSPVISHLLKADVDI